MSNIEDDVKVVKRYLENSSYKESNSDFFKNGGWEIVDLEIPQAMSNIMKEREQDKARIKELEEENMEKDLEKIGIQQDTEANMKEIIERYYTANEECIPKQKVKDILNEIQEEYDKVQEQFDCIWNKKSKDNYDRYKLQELSAMQQELGFVLGKFEELLEEGE